MGKRFRQPGSRTRGRRRRRPEARTLLDVPSPSSHRINSRPSTPPRKSSDHTHGHSPLRAPPGAEYSRRERGVSAGWGNPRTRRPEQYVPALATAQLGDRRRRARRRRTARRSALGKPPAWPVLGGCGGQACRRRPGTSSHPLADGMTVGIAHRRRASSRRRGPGGGERHDAGNRVAIVVDHANSDGCTGKVSSARPTGRDRIGQELRRRPRAHVDDEYNARQTVGGCCQAGDTHEVRGTSRRTPPVGAVHDGGEATDR